MPNKRSQAAMQRKKQRKKEREEKNALEYFRKRFRKYHQKWKRGEVSDSKLYQIANEFEAINEYCMHHLIPTLSQWRQMNRLHDPYEVKPRQGLNSEFAETYGKQGNFHRDYSDYKRAFTNTLNQLRGRYKELYPHLSFPSIEVQKRTVQNQMEFRFSQQSHWDVDDHSLFSQWVKNAKYIK